MAERILIVDDEIDMLELLKRIIEDKTDYQVVITPDPLAVPQILEENIFDLVITDLRMPGQNGLELLEIIRGKDNQIPIVILTAYGTIESAVEAMQKGAFSYITKPFKKEEILLTIEKAFNFQRLTKENLNLRNELEEKLKFPFLIGQSPMMEKVYQKILQVAKTSATVLITGDSGTGKELAAKTLHFQSQRKDKNFVAVNCSAIPEPLIESELFGHLKGSFTGAIRDKKGLVEEADRGTLFLDEIGDLNLVMQTKLLRLLQEGEYKPVGSSKTLIADIRFVAATNQDLMEKVQRKEFREDLFYRLNVIQIVLPPLRDRKEDIPILAQHFLEKFNRLNQKQIKGIEPGALEVLINRDWPGNIRELENVIERGVILSRTDILQVADLFPEDQPASFPFKIQENIFLSPFKEAKENIINNFHIEYIRRVLAKHGGNVSLAAKECGLKRPYLHRLMRDNDIKSKTYRHSG
ncbi:MAG: sigma-54-dependent Fis family transcriptional regulator [Deltaproteobacteria bacterium]|nr:sigma-54-dependent Fis family transcriptional regulator [Deltaproteobacteria bacterium]